MVDISAVIVTWNAKQLVAGCLDSLSTESRQGSLEIIVVDNASSDGAPELVRSTYPHVRLIRNEENLGFAKATNIGINASAGRYICLINSDIVVLDGCLDKMRNYMDANQHIGVLGPKVLNADRTLQPSCRSFPGLWSGFCRALALDKLLPRSKAFGREFMTHWSHETASRVDYLSGCFMMARREAVNQVGLLDEDFFFYAEDKDWCKRFWDKGWEVVYYPDAAVVHYMCGSSSRDPIKYYVQEIRANLHYYLKHHGQRASFIFLMISLLHQVMRILGVGMLWPFLSASDGVRKESMKRSLAGMSWILGMLFSGAWKYSDRKAR